MINVIGIIVTNTYDKYKYYVRYKFKEFFRGKLLFKIEIDELHPIYQFLSENIMTLDEFYFEDNKYFFESKNNKIKIFANEHKDKSIYLESKVYIEENYNSIFVKKFNYEDSIIKFKFITKNEDKKFIKISVYSGNNKSDDILYNFLKDRFNFNIDNDLFYYYYFDSSKSQIWEYFSKINCAGNLNRYSGNRQGHELFKIERSKKSCKYRARQYSYMDNNFCVDDYELNLVDNVNNVYTPNVLNPYNKKRIIYGVHNNMLYSTIGVTGSWKQDVVVVTKSKLSTSDLTKEMVHYLNHNTHYIFSLNNGIFHGYIDTYGRIGTKRINYKSLGKYKNLTFRDHKLNISDELKDMICHHIINSKSYDMISKKFGFQKEDKYILYGPDNSSKLLVACLIFKDIYTESIYVVNDYRMLYDLETYSTIIKNSARNMFFNVKLNEIQEVMKLMETLKFNKYVVSISDEFVSENILRTFDYVFKFDYCNKSLIKKILTESIDSYLQFIITKKDFKNMDLYKDVKVGDYEDRIELFANNVQHCKMLPITLQKYIIKYVDNIDSIFDNWEELVKIERI